MKIIQTETLTEEFMRNTPYREWIYNGMDSLLTAEILPKIKGYFKQGTGATYGFALSLRAPLMEMMLRGCLIDPEDRARLINEYNRRSLRLQMILNSYGEALGFKGLNPGSHQQLKKLFYEIMKLPEQFTSDKGKKRLSVNRECLEKLQEYFHARPIISAIFAYRDCQKKLSVLRGRKTVRDAILGGDNVINEDGRFRTSISVGTTETGRLSSSASAWGTGTNSQNITEELRRMFIADAGKKLCYPDLSAAESMAVAYISGDPNYIEACHSGDPHTYVAKLCWPGLPWTGDLRADREVASRPYYRHFSYRDMAKRGGHASNYYAKPFTISRHLKIPVPVAREFQDLYFSAFPGIPRWHQRVATNLQLDGAITTALGFERVFFGRRYDDTTLREAIAFEPQSLVAFILNQGLLRIWNEYREVELIFQVHDAVLCQYPEELEQEILPKLVDALEIPVEVRERTMKIRAEAMIGWNWGKADPKRKLHRDGNPDGLIDWSPEKPDERSRQAQVGTVLDICLPGLPSTEGPRAAPALR